MDAKDAMTVTLLESGPWVLEDFRDHAPHAREAAFGLIAGGLAPLAGYLLAGWSAGSMFAAVMFNLCLAIIDRGLGLLEGRGQDLDRHAARWVWACAAFRSGRTRRLPARHFRRQRSDGSEWVPVVFAALTAIIMVPLYMKMSGSDWHVAEIFGGTLLAFLFHFGSGLLGRGRQGRSSIQHRHPFPAEAVIAGAGGYAAILGPAIAQGDVSEPAITTLTLAVVIPMVALGVLRLVDLDRKQALADWLDDWLDGRGESGETGAASS